MRSRRDDDMDGSPLLASLILYSPADAPLPLDAAFALGDHNHRRPGVLSGRADLEEGIEHHDHEE